jgi:hypothetical protein
MKEVRIIYWRTIAWMVLLPIVGILSMLGKMLAPAPERIPPPTAKKVVSLSDIKTDRVQVFMVERRPGSAAITMKADALGEAEAIKHAATQLKEGKI